MANITLSENVRKYLQQTVMYLMLGFILGFLLFYKIFPYFCAPMNTGMPTWTFVVALIAIGGVSGYLYPDIMNVLAGSIIFPVLGGMFCFIIFMSPSMSGDIVVSGLSEDLVFLARILLFDMLIVFLATFTSGFAAVYLFEASE